MDVTDAQAIQARMDEIIGELSASGFKVNVHGPNSSGWRTVLEREYSALAARRPKTGAQAGVVEINRRLGTGFIPPPAPAEHETDDEIRADPMLRYMVETGQNWR